MPADRDSHRLPTDVLPHHYRLLLRPDLAAGTLVGSVTIEVEVRVPTTRITLHSLGLRISTAELRLRDREPPELLNEQPGAPADGEPLVASIDTDLDREWVTLTLPREVGPGTAELHLDYEGEFSDQLVGLYRSSFEIDGEDHALAVTQFESTHARRALPCFDEPEFKARFSVTLEIPEGLMAVSNAPETGREPTDEGLVRITFADTGRMSTYLLAMVVGPLEATGTRMVSGREGSIELRVVHPPGKAELCEFALDVAEAGLIFFEDYYDLPYPGDKVDLVAVPDFAFGAMENLGCITFREVLLLVDPATATPQELQRVADVINHELAHMWFGDLVTMKWWNGIWLNEAFATFMEVTATDDLRPDWDVWTTFGLARAAAFETDALLSTRPVEYEVITATDAEGMFDILTYEKGCSVVRMLEQYLGPRRFRDGIRAYLRLNAWGNTETTDLWDALEDATGEPVRAIMDEWIFHGGHPLVAVETTPTGVRLHQERALLDAEAAGSGAQHGFPVPLVMQTVDTQGRETTRRLLLEAPTTVELGSAPERVQPNVGGNGFFRTLLDTPARLNLARGGGTPLERFVLVDDTWFAMRSGHLGLGEALATIVEVAAAGEDDPSVWRRIAGVCGDLARYGAEDHRGLVGDWVLALLEQPRTAFPVDGGPGVPGSRSAEVAATLLATAGNSGEDPTALDTARSLFGQPGGEPAIAAAALEVVARHATVEEHAEIERRWRNADTPQDEQRHLSALVLTTHPALFARTLELVESDVRTQDAPYVIRRALANPWLGPTAWAGLTDSWDRVSERFPAGSLPRMIEGIRGFTDRTLADDVASFLAARPLATGSRQVEQHVEAMWANVAAARRFRSAVTELA